MKLLRWSDSDRREPVGPVNGRNRSPTGWSRPADCRTCPTLRNLFPTYPSSFSPISPFFSVPPSINFNFSNGSTTTSSSPHTARRQGPASPHSLRRSTPPATSEAEARGASTFHHGGLFGVYSQLASPPSLAAALVHFRRQASTIVLLREHGGF